MLPICKVGNIGKFGKFDWRAAIESHVRSPFSWLAGAAEINLRRIAMRR